VLHPENGKIQVVVRRRRTRRHRRNRILRRWLAVAFLGVFSAGASTLALQYFSPSLFRADQAPGADQTQLSHNRAADFSQIVPQARPARTIYPYSVVPGGVEDAKELKWVAEHDPIVAAHYAGFDYDHAQVVRLTLARTVYISYRIGSRIYWTSHRVTLKKGEKLITDGRMTARTRCANRVEEKPQVEASSGEPTPEKFDQPVREGDGTAAQAPPVVFQSSLLDRPQAPGLEPAGPLSLYNPFVGGSWVAMAPPPLPISMGVCGTDKKKGTTGFGGGGNKKKPVPCGSGTVPEPGTWVLIASGLAAISWQARRRFSRG
jgi:PEP-CTERM motif-containing protein